MFLENQLRWYLLVVLLVCATELQAQTPPRISTTKIDPTAEACTLSGMVVGKADGAPLKGATVHQITRLDCCDHPHRSLGRPVQLPDSIN